MNPTVYDVDSLRARINALSMVATTALDAPETVTQGALAARLCINAYTLLHSLQEAVDLLVTADQKTPPEIDLNTLTDDFEPCPVVTTVLTAVLDSMNAIITIPSDEAARQIALSIALEKAGGAAVVKRTLPEYVQRNSALAEKLLEAASTALRADAPPTIDWQQPTSDKFSALADRAYELRTMAPMLALGALDKLDEAGQLLYAGLLDDIGQLASSADYPYPQLEPRFDVEQTKLVCSLEGVDPNILLEAVYPAYLESAVPAINDEFETVMKVLAKSNQ